MTDYWRCFRRGRGEDQHISGAGDGVQPGQMQTLCSGAGRECDCGFDRAFWPGGAAKHDRQPAGQAESQVRHDGSSGAGASERFQVRGSDSSDPEESRDREDRDREIRKPAVAYYTVSWRLSGSDEVFTSNTGSARSADMLLELLCQDPRISNAYVEAVFETDWPF